MPPIKYLGISGTHGSGKSTLAGVLGEMLGLVPVTYSRPSVAAVKMGFGKASLVPPELDEEFQWMALIEQVSVERSVSGCVVDRTVIDYAAYYLLRCELAGVKPNPAYTAVCRNHVGRYDAILYLPPNNNGVEDNGRRFTEHAARTDELIVQIAGEFGVAMIQIATDGVGNRAAEVRERLIQLGFDGRWAREAVR